MRLLDAAVAFAICIAGFATIVTVMIEILHRVLRLRTKGLKEMLETYYVDVLAPELRLALDKVATSPRLSWLAGHQFVKLSDADRATMKEWIAQMLMTPLQGRTAVHWYVDALSDATKLSTADFVKRLKETALYQQWDEAMRARMAAFEDKYDEYCDAMSDYFARRAQMLSLVAGMVLAVCVNIDGIRLFERFLSDPELAHRVEAQSAALQKQLDATKASGFVDASAPGAKQTESTLAGLQEARGRLDSLASLYADMQLPIGWTQFPGCTDLKRGAPGHPAAERCEAIAATVWQNFQKNTRGVLVWLLAVVLTGALIGLGGPFWFDVAKKVASFRDSVKKGSGSDAPSRRMVAP